jgi:hypothetical protein
VPPAVVAIAAIVATVAVEVFVTSAIVAALLTIAINVAATLLMRRPSGSKARNQGTELKLKLDPTMPRQLALGWCATGGSVVWAFTYGSESGVPQGAYLVRIIALCDLPVEGSFEVYDGKTRLTFSGDPTTGLVECTNKYRSNGGRNLMTCQIYPGSPNAVADANLISWSGGQWTSAHKGTNMAYAIVRYRFDPDGLAFPNGEPQLIWVFKGVKCYDDRLDGTKPGRIGGHRLDNPATWTFTENTAILTAQSLRGFYSNGVHLFGAQAEDRDLSDSMLISAYNTCDEAVTIGAGPFTQKRYEAGIMVNCAEPLAEYLVEFQAAMDGRILDRGGAITILPGATRTPVFNLTDDDVDWSLEKSWQPRATLNELYNHVAGVFVDMQTVFHEKAYPPLRNATWEAQDGGERLTLNVSFAAITNWIRVQRITKRIHEASRFQGTIAFVGPLWLMEMEQGDWFTFTSSRWNFATKYFEAVLHDINVEGKVIIVGREVSPVIDGWNPVVDEVPRSDTFWNPPATGLPTPEMINIFSLIDASSPAGIQVGTQFQFFNVGPSALPTSVHVEMAYSSNLAGAWGAGVFPPDEALVHRIIGLAEGTDYSMRARTADGQWFSNWSGWYNFTTGTTSFGITVTGPAEVVFQADHLGNLVAGQLPYDYFISVQKNGADIRATDEMDYAAIMTNATGTVNAIDGDPNKGTVTINTFTGQDSPVTIIAYWNGTEVGRVLTTLRWTTSPIPPGSTGGSGGAGTKSVTITTFSLPNSTTVPAVLAGPVTVTTAGGEKLYGSGVLAYRGNHNLGVALQVKWQYSPAGAGTWTDFAAYKNGSPAYPRVLSGEYFEPAIQGTVDTAQNVNPGGAGNWDVRLVGIYNRAAATTLGSTALVEAKV